MIPRFDLVIAFADLQVQEQERELRAAAVRVEILQESVD